MGNKVNDIDKDNLKLVYVKPITDGKDYYEYDYAYVMNMLWSDYCNIFTETSYYKKMAKSYLEDPDYMGKADERAYHNAMKRIKYFEKE